MDTIRRTILTTGAAATAMAAAPRVFAHVSMEGAERADSAGDPPDPVVPPRAPAGTGVEGSWAKRKHAHHLLS